MFGSTKTPAFSTPTRPGSLFPQTSTPSIGGGLFGSSATIASQPSTGGGLFGGGTSTAQTNTVTSSLGGGSLFGSTAPAATTTTAPTFGSGGTGLFGSSGTMAAKPGSLFGSASNTSIGGQKPGSLFGSTATGTGGSLFGSTQKPGMSGSLFGQTTVSQQPATAALKSLETVISNSQALVAALAKPLVYGDDRDQLVCRLNNILSAVGTGNAYYGSGKPPHSFDQYNPYFMFKGIGYCALSKHRDIDGVVALTLGTPVSNLETPEQKQKVIDALFTILGNDPTVHANLIRAYAISESVSEVEIYVTKKGVGRVPAQQLYKFFEQKERKTSLQNQLKCDKVTPRVEMLPVDIERYYGTPPQSFTEAVWKQAIMDNPDPDNLIPYPIYGFKEILARRQLQGSQAQAQDLALESYKQRLQAIKNDVAEVKSVKKILREQAGCLKLRILRLIMAINAKVQGTAVINLDEERLINRLETLSVCLNGPGKLQQRCGRIAEYFDKNNTEISIRKADLADHEILTAEEKETMRKYLTRRQSDMETISKCLVENIDDFSVMIKHT